MYKKCRIDEKIKEKALLSGGFIKRREFHQVGLAGCAISSQNLIRTESEGDYLTRFATLLSTPRAHTQHKLLTKLTQIELKTRITFLHIQKYVDEFHFNLRAIERILILFCIDRLRLIIYIYFKMYVLLLRQNQESYTTFSAI